MSEPTNPRPVEVHMAVFDAKLDGIKSMLEVRNAAQDNRLTKLSEDLAMLDRHHTNALTAQSEAFVKLLDAKTDKVQSEARYSDVIGRVGKLEDSQTWLWRTVCGGVIAAVLAYVWTNPDKIHPSQSQGEVRYVERTVEK